MNMKKFIEFKKTELKEHLKEYWLCYPLGLLGIFAAVIIFLFICFCMGWLINKIFITEKYIDYVMIGSAIICSTYVIGWIIYGSKCIFSEIFNFIKNNIDKVNKGNK